MTKIITDGQARRVASHWHGGSASAMYAFVSTGYIDFQPLMDEIAALRREWGQNEDAPLHRTEFDALTRYVRDRGPRGKQEGWFGTWDDTPVSV